MMKSNNIPCCSETSYCSPQCSWSEMNIPDLLCQSPSEAGLEDINPEEFVW